MNNIGEKVMTGDSNMASKEKQFICTSCPMGCLLKGLDKGGEIIISGNSCPRGLTYGLQEMTRPKRMVTTTILVNKGQRKLVPCKTKDPIDKDLIFKLMEVINKHSVDAPIRVGDVLIKNVLGSSVDIVATANVDELIK